jgi:hypothetical protein
MRTNINDDVQGCLLEQASALRQRDADSVDWDNLAEELEDLAARRREALRSDLTIILVHMLKLAYESRPTEKQRRERQWKLDLLEHGDMLTTC